jgi:hypothetical protein
VSEQQALAEAAKEQGHRHPVTILVNEQPVEVLGPRTTGREIKQAAIDAGLPIDLGFQLVEEMAHGRTRIVGDTDIVEVRPRSRFLALAPDDNS